MFRDLAPQVGQRGIAGVSVAGVEEGSRAAANGLRPGDIITALNQRDVDDLDEFERALAQKPRQVLLTVVRGRTAFYLLLE